MKKILFRKLLFDYLSFIFFSLLGTGIVIWVFQAVNFLDIMIEDGRDYLVYVNFSLLNFPKILSKIFPFVLFFSLFYVTIKYEINNELMIFWNFGVHKLEIFNLIFKTSIFFVLIQIILTSIIVPKTQDVARSFLRSSNVNFFGNFIKPQKFNDTIKGLTIYSDKKDNEDNLSNIYIKKDITNGFQITYAKKGKIKEIGLTPILILYNGATITSTNNEITNISFSKSDFSLGNLETNTTTYKKTQEISSYKILKCINNFFKFKKEKFETAVKYIENCSVQNIENIFKEFYKRFIIPFYIPILSLVPLMLIISSKESLNYNKVRLFIFLLGLGVIIFSETTIRFVSETLIQNIILIIFPIIFLITLYYCVFYKLKTNLKIN